MGFLSRVLLLAKSTAVKVNLFTNNFRPYDSSTNTSGILYSSYAVGDITNKTITHTATAFSSSSAYITTGFTALKNYKYSVTITGATANYTFIRVKCLSSTNSMISDTTEMIGSTSITFTVPTGTAKIQIFVGTASGHTGSSIFSNIKVEEV